MNILGINAFHGDSAACLVVDGKLVAAAEEERFRRIKHWAGFPSDAIRYCLKRGGLTIEQLDHVAVNRNPNANLLEKALFSFRNRPSLRSIQDRLRNAAKVRDVRTLLAGDHGVDAKTLACQFHQVEHHRAHLASSFFVSPFDSAALLSVDGFGDFVSTEWGIGKGSRIEVIDSISFPHSLGLFYLAVTQYLGFPEYGDEYKTMGLSGYGKPVYLDKMRKIVRLRSDGRFELDLDYFLHHSEGISMTWEKGRPEIGNVYSGFLSDLLGPARSASDPIEERHRDIAASMQAMYEEAFFHVLSQVWSVSKDLRLCLAGGCALNGVANGKIASRTPFRRLYVQPASGDAGGAIGAAFWVWNQVLGGGRIFTMDHAYWGPEFDEKEISSELRARSSELEREKCVIEKIADTNELCRKVAKAIADGKVVGWFQGRMEWGPRALGNRSILCDPRRADMQKILNLKIKRRESFRPFAPSILREKVSEWFESDVDVPFMLQVIPIRPERRAEIPAVTHVDGTGRLQTVTRDQNPLYYALISAFEKKTGVPILLNTSFNENEPIVDTPFQAVECFLRTNMDLLVLGDRIVERR